MQEAILRMYDGTMVDALNLREDQVHPPNFIHALSLINRYAGNTVYPYSVAQHSLLLYDTVPEELKKAALIHDWSEALVSDIATPLKLLLPKMEEIEYKITKVICKALDVPVSSILYIKEYDRRIRQDEMQALFDPPYDYGEPPLEVDIHHIPWVAVRRMYSRMYAKEFNYPEDNFRWLS